MSTEDVKQAADSLQSDMAEHQRKHGGKVTAEANQRLVATEFEKLEKQGVFDRAERQQELPENNGSQAVEREVIERHNLVAVKDKDTTQVRGATVFEAQFMQHALPRLELLLTKLEPGPLGSPSWAQRVMAVQQSRALAASLRTWASDPVIFRKQRDKASTMNPLERSQMFHVLGMTGMSDFTVGHLHKKAEDLERQYLVELLQVLEDSSSVFGDWRSAPATRTSIITGMGN